MREALLLAALGVAVFAVVVGLLWIGLVVGYGLGGRDEARKWLREFEERSRS